MRLAIAFVAMTVAGGFAQQAQAGCIHCPDGYSYWHSKEACVPRIQGFVGTPPASTWVEALPRSYTVGEDEDLAASDTGPSVER